MLVTELLAVSRRLAKGGDLVGARDKAQEANDAAMHDAEMAACDEWAKELEELEQAQFMQELGGAPAGANASPAAGEATVYLGGGLNLHRDGREELAATRASEPTVLPGGDGPRASAVAAEPLGTAPAVAEKREAVAARAEPTSRPVLPPAAHEPRPGAPESKERAGDEPPKFVDPRLEAFLEGKAPVADDRERSVERDAKLLVGAQDVSLPDGKRGDAPRKPKKSVQERVFSPEVLVLVGGLSALAFVLEPWKWGASPQVEATAGARDARYPDIQFRARTEPVTPEEVRGKFYETKAPPKPEFTGTLPVAPPAPPPPVVPAPVAGQGAIPVAAVVPVPRQAHSGGSARPGTAAAGAPVAAAPVAPAATPASAAAADNSYQALYGTGAELNTGAVVARSGSDKPAADVVHIPMNTKLRVALQIGITSTKHDSVVLAKLRQAIKQGDHVLVPQGALLKGQSSSDNDRIYIHFTELIIDGKKSSLVAAAVEGDLAGVKAQKRQATLEERQQARVGQGMLGVAAEIAADAAGVGGAAVRGVTGGAVQETQRAQEYDASVVLWIPAKTQFDAVVTE